MSDLDNLDIEQLRQLSTLVETDAARQQITARIQKLEADRPWQAAAMGAVDTITGGFADEIAGAADYITSLGSPRGWNQQVDDYMSGLEDSNPNSFLGGQFIGGLAIPAAGARALMARGAGPFLTGALTGGSGAGIYSIGSQEREEGEETPDYLLRAAGEAGVDTLVGAATGGTLAKGIDVASVPIRGAIDILSDLRPGQRSAANRVVAGALDDDGLSSVARIRDEADLLGPEAMLADLGESTRMTGATFARPAGPGRTYAMDALDTRNAGSLDRIDATVLDTISPGFEGTARQFQQSMREQLRRQAQPLYEEAYEIPIRINGRLRSLVQNPLFREAVDGADLNRQWRIGLDETGTGAVNAIEDTASTEMMHNVLKRLNTMIEQAKPNDLTGGGDRDRYRALVALKDAVREEVFDQNDPFRMAQQIFSDERSLERAMEAGQDVLGQTGRTASRAPDILDEINALSEAERGTFRVGVLDSVQSRLETMPMNVGRSTGDGSRRVINNQRDQDILRGIIPEGADDLLDTLDAEATFRQTRNMFSASPTAPLSETANRAIPQTREGLMGRAAATILDRLGSGRIDDVGREQISRALYTRIADLSDEQLESIINGGILSNATGDLLQGLTTGASASVGVLAPDFTYRD